MAVTGLAAVLLAIAALLVVVSAVQPVARRLEISETVLLALAGIVLGGSADLVLRSSYTELFNGAAETLLDFPLNSEAFLLIFLPALVFQGALAIDVRRLAHETATVLLLAVVAVVVSTATIGLALFPFAGLPLSVCLLLGAIVATTDPSAVAGIFRDIGASSRLTRLVEGEALLNDAAAISIFSLLLAAVTSHHSIAPGSALLEFLVSFIGAIVMGVLFGRLTLLMITTIGAAPAAEITLTVALPYIVYILCDEFLGFSGVVAAASAGLTMSVYGPSTFRPQTWRFLNELWQQLVFWAGSLVFVLASMLVPRLLVGMTRWDCVLILLATGAGLLARGAVVFGLLPLLAATRLSPPVPTPFKITMVWGGLRGAITLALALAVTENQHVSTPVAHFIGIIATGFVLITLFVNGTTLRYLVLFLKLDQLSPIDQALRHQVLGIGLGEVRDRTSEVAEELGFSRAVSDTVISQLGRQVEEEEQANTFDTALGDRQRVTLALIVIANRERSILLDLFRIQGLSRPVMETLLRSAEAMVDGARLEGRFGYVRAMRRRLRPSLRFRLAQAIHHRFHFDQPLMSCMTERFEMLMISYFVSLSLIRFMRTRMEPTLGSRIGEIVGEVLERQRKLLNEALQTLRLHYQGYSEALEMRLLQQVSLRLEGEEYDSLLSESLISDELHRELHRDVERRRGHLGAPLVFNIKAGIEARMRALPVFQGLSDEALHAIAPQFSIHFTSPGERLYRRGRRVRTVYFISAGLAETHFPEHDVRFGAGDVIGAEEALSRMPARAVTRSLQFGQFLTISTRRFRRLVAEYPDILANLDELTRARHTTERSGVALLPGDSAVVRASDDAIALATADLADALPESADRPDDQQGPSP
ncbi:sodium:proton antiporter [Gluconacetobacter liquefaciens]|uniref:Sodium/proton antiporter (CPA1 family) n=1 Tax=Gluconacetobacter liquefaciens TaxID=89584 RepID=A0A370G1M2_GLULI|nr:cation:proton antiporter [Gluconacetobacter liquefaciens]MBB2187629.1 sodium:proton antiporter [Gluconacetobacter liquefaciens]RDI36524.1 sodium/proton antiporter (CPA1 family) [Gluconacetobacter liquefaciens]GEB37475.1 sodium:proton antiporter [Gluconacetobacter liquefaciens]